MCQSGTRRNISAIAVELALGLTDVGPDYRTETLSCDMRPGQDRAVGYCTVTRTSFAGTKPPDTLLQPNTARS
jgi:hypothetical protein